MDSRNPIAHAMGQTDLPRPGDSDPDMNEALRRVRAGRPGGAR